MHADRSDSIPSSGSALTLELRSFLKHHLPDHMIPAAFVTLPAVPLLPNGKVDYRSLPIPEFDRSQASSPFVAPHTSIEERLARIWEQTLRVRRVGIHDNFFELGGDSILSIQIAARASQAGIKLSPRQMFQHPTIAELARVAALRATDQVTDSQELVVGPMPLTPIQQWFLEQDPPEPQHFNQALLLSLRQPVDLQRLEQALQAVATHHQALRLRFTRTEQGWQQQFSADDSSTLIFEIVDLADMPEVDRAAAMQVTAAQVQRSLDLERGPLARAVYFKLGANNSDRLLLIVHHLVVDGVSWRILLEDLYSAYQQLEWNQDVTLPGKTTPFHVWSHRLAEYAQLPDLATQVDYWTAQERLQAAKLPVDRVVGENTYESARTLEVALERDETEALLHEASSAYRTQINDLLLAALTLALARWTGQRQLLINLEGHGREEVMANIDLSRTVGWFTTLFPVLLTPGPALEAAATIKTIKEQLRAIPQRGIGYGVLRYLTDELVLRERLQAMPQPEISFNYFGQLDQTLAEVPLFGSADEPIGPVVSPRSRRQHLLDINASVREGQLRIEWTYSQHHHSRETIAALAESLLAALRELIAHCRSAEAGGYTPSDFPLAGLTQQQIDRLFGNDRQIEAVYPLSSLQQGMLFHALYAPAGGDYITQMRFVFGGALDRDALVMAWQQVTDRYAILRTGFIWEDLDEPLQVVRKQVAVPFALHDWRGLSEAEQTQRLDAYLEGDRRQGFDPAQAPLLRLVLFQLSDDRYACVWSNHHLVIDGWSLPLVLDDMFAFYTAARHGESLRLAPAQPYAEYIAWLLRQDQRQAESFWRDLLRGFTAPTPLGIDHAPGTLLSAQRNYHAQWLHFSSETTQGLQRLAREQRLTVNTLLQGAWAVLLSRYSGHDDVVFGTTVSGRPTEIPGVETIVGMFVNTLPTRARLAPDMRLLPWLQELQAQASQVRQYEYSSLVHVQAWSDVPRGSQLFDSMMVFENYPVSASKLSDASEIQIEIMPSLEQTNYPLTLVAVPGDQLSIKLMYDRDHIDDDAIARMHGHFQTILEAMLRGIDQQIGDLPILTPAEQQQILFDWNNTAAPVAHESYSQLFEAQAARTPDAIAVMVADRHLTYHDLNQQANQLAHYLCRLGVVPEARVGICLTHSLNLVVALLGVLKAGAAYVPLDPSYPQQRLQFMLTDAQIFIVLTERHLRAQLPDSGVRVVEIDTDAEQIGAESCTNLSRLALPDNSAYIIYTSGSTGWPKGVIIPHRGLVNYLSWSTGEYRASAGSGAPVHSPIGFDLTVTSLFAPLLVGQRVLLLPEDQYLDGLAHALQPGAQFSLVKLTPAHVHLLNQALPAETLAGRANALVIGGEALLDETVAFWRQHAPQTRLINEYGPTETVVGCCIYEIPPTGAISSIIPIGRPIANVQIYVLDRQLQPVPVAVPGELYIGGVQLARGYVNRPDLTAERFLPHPFSTDPGARLYRTGDLARYRADGTIEFLGRIDQQVKIRGFRIELGEIEAQLNHHPAVHEAVVDVRDTGLGTQLIAYVVPNENVTAEPIDHHLREYVKARLPEYMIPAAFVVLDALPLTSNGKINRQALPMPDFGKTATAFVAPRNEIEHIVAEVWRDLLQLQRVSVHSRFLDLGGHSLLATRVTSRIGATLGIDLPVRSLFEAPTIAELAELIEVIRWSSQQPPESQDMGGRREQGEL
ncbi:MAG TPA: amino acid adenylation domain-containing protein [Herpetosiphonaceae bacterium]